MAIADFINRRTFFRCPFHGLAYDSFYWILILFQTLQNRYGQKFHHCKYRSSFYLAFHIQVAFAIDDGILRKNRSFYGQQPRNAI
ncbi:hypothetical protein D9M72_538870 [compost metagenome]